jgi:hypothetical protein
MSTKPTSPPADPTIKTTVSQAMTSVQLYGGHDHDHGRDLGLDQT